MHDIFKAIILGIIQGLTEFIPVSSTGHLIISGELLEFSGAFAKTFDIAIQLGSIMAVVIVYKESFREYLRFKPNLKVYPNIFHIALTLLPIMIVGYLGYGFIKTHLFNSFTVAIGLILGAILMMLADYYHRRTKQNKEISYKKSLVVGLFQCLSLWPGMSRSGSTISGGIFAGMNHKTAASYSFICAVPVMLVATVFELFKTESITSNELLLLAIGFIVAFFVGWASIVVLIRLVAKIKLFPFAIYRIILAIIILSSSLGGKSA